MLRHIDSTSRNQVDAPWYTAQHTNWAGVEDLHHFKVSLFRMVSIIKDL
ncbi:Uncharacterised protein [Vibrio cholerae]|nr:Uncharacterised protein [Vibrio cholerae]